jgi:hypothetical protein
MIYNPAESETVTIIAERKKGWPIDEIIVGAGAAVCAGVIYQYKKSKKF